MKYLIIAAVVAFLFVVIYSRLRPYLLIIQKVANSLNASVSVGTSTVGEKVVARNKLVRCESCGTWIPHNRAIRLGSGLSNYCSTECLEKQATAKERKFAG